MNGSEEEMATETVYGGLEGPDSIYIKLIAADGHEFILKREHALCSGIIAAMLVPQQIEIDYNVIQFREIPSHVIEKVCKWFAFKARHNNSPVPSEQFPIEPEVAVELAMVSRFLDF